MVLSYEDSAGARLLRRAPRNIAHKSTVTRPQSAPSANAISNFPEADFGLARPYGGYYPPGIYTGHDAGRKHFAVFQLGIHWQLIDQLPESRPITATSA